MGIICWGSFAFLLTPASSPEASLDLSSMSHMLISSVLAASCTRCHSGHASAVWPLLASPFLPTSLAFFLNPIDFLFLGISDILRLQTSELTLSLFLLHLSWLCFLINAGRTETVCVINIFWIPCGNLPQYQVYSRRPVSP